MNLHETDNPQLSQRAYPFFLAESLRHKIPVPAASGVAFVDVKVMGKWHGVLAVNAQGACIGHVNDRSQVHTVPVFPFRPTEIEDVRSACPWNRFIAWLPFSLIVATPYAAILVNLVLLFVAPLLGWTIGAPILAGVLTIPAWYVLLRLIGIGRSTPYCITGLLLLAALIGCNLISVARLLSAFR